MINMHQNSQFTLGNMEERRKMQTVLYSSASEPNSIICSAQSRTLEDMGLAIFSLLEKRSP